MKKERLPTSHQDRIKDKGMNMEKELGNFLKDFPISLSLIPSFMCYEVSLMGLKLVLESYLSHVSIYGDLCVISFGGGLFLVVSYASTCLSSHAFLEDSLLHNGSIFDPSCHDFGVMNNASIESIVVSFGFDAHALSLEGKIKMEFIELLHFENYEANDVKHKKFGKTPKALKSKLERFEGQERASKLFSMCSISKDHSREQIEGENGKTIEEEYPIIDCSPAPTVADRLLSA
ncbi:hypothetical protein M9H77_26753 [Catharanthus roseus]|uniref:Uncharacterized protein n=1 Tax=Catharanthus roseus TaxID=4058 RepID=A0ACC0AC42_CATRO|nr:hypothetical protein M9H77_26753 [Catharanthus roseus]